MSRLLALKCPDCDATVSPPADAVRCTCEFCGKTFSVAPTIVLPERPLPGAGRAPSPPRASASGKLGAIIAGAIVLSATVPLVAIVMGRNTGSLRPSAASAQRRNAGEKRPARTYLWDDVVPSAVASADGRELIVGRIRSRVGDPDDQLFVVAVDGATLEERWRVGPLGTYSEAYRSTLLAVGGGVVVVSDKSPRLHVVDLATGHDDASRGWALSDAASALCAGGDGARAWVEVVDGKNLLVDFGKHEGHAQPRPPAWCHPVGISMGAGRATARGPKLTGARVEAALTDGDAGVALAVKAPGTPTPRAVGFDPRTLEQRWESPLAPPGQAAEHHFDWHVALAGGRAVVEYTQPSDSSTHLVALDAATGRRLWDVPVEANGQISELHLTAARAYVVLNTKLTVLDAESGVVRGELGF